MKPVFVKLPLVFLLLMYLLLPASAQKQTEETSANAGLNYLLYHPEDQKVPLPLLVFLHGIGERGDNLEIVKRHGPPKLISSGAWPADLPFIVVSPQLPAKYTNWPPDKVNHLISDIIERYSVDENRIYLTGSSMGGAGTWRYAIRYPDRLAAALPICGYGNPQKACAMKKVPVWAFHGKNDRVVNPKESIRMVMALRNCQQIDTAQIKLTLYPNTGHNAWARTYRNPAIYQWLLSFTRKNLKNTGWKNNEQRILGPDTTAFQTICSLPASLRETSGLISDTSYMSWSHNDSGNAPTLIKFDTTGKVLSWKKITNATNFDWEDLAKDENGNFYIGDIGNNNNNRKHLQIYKIPHPDSVAGERIHAEVIQFSFPDQTHFPAIKKNFDVEAMVSVDRHVYLFTKNRTVPFDGYTKMYRVPNVPGEYSAELLDSIKLGNGNIVESWITGAAISPDGSRLVLLSYNSLWLFDGFKENDFFSGRLTPIALPHFTQKEAVSFVDNEILLITDELLKNIVGGKLYRLNLNKYLHTDL